MTATNGGPEPSPTEPPRPPETTGPDGVPPSGGLSRRGFLVAVAGTSGLLVAVTAGQTVPGLSPIAVFAPSKPHNGPQGRTVNRTAAEAGVADLANARDYALRVEGPLVPSPAAFTLADLGRLPQSEIALPISCVQGWSFSARWGGVRLRDLLAAAGVTERPGRVDLESLEQSGVYRTSTLPKRQARADNTMIALRLNGETLVLDHGYPARLVAPNRPGVLQTKWLAKVVAS